MSLSRTFLDVRPLRTSPVFRRLLFGRTVSTLGTFMTMVTVMYQVWAMTHSTVWSGAVGIAAASFGISPQDKLCSLRLSHIHELTAWNRAGLPSA
jgi:hypothetical protein